MHFVQHEAHNKLRWHFGLGVVVSVECVCCIKTFFLTPSSQSVGGSESVIHWFSDTQLDEDKCR